MTRGDNGEARTLAAGRTSLRWGESKKREGQKEQRRKWGGRRTPGTLVSFWGDPGEGLERFNGGGT